MDLSRIRAAHSPHPIAARAVENPFPAGVAARKWGLWVAGAARTFPGAGHPSWGAGRRWAAAGQTLEAAAVVAVLD